jgi:hypothetical protein
MVFNGRSGGEDLSVIVRVNGGAFGIEKIQIVTAQHLLLFFLPAELDEIAVGSHKTPFRVLHKKSNFRNMFERLCDKGCQRHELRGNAEFHI